MKGSQGWLRLIYDKKDVFLKFQRHLLRISSIKVTAPSSRSFWNERGVWLLASDIRQNGCLPKFQRHLLRNSSIKETVPSFESLWHEAVARWTSS